MEHLPGVRPSRKLPMPAAPLLFAAALLAAPPPTTYTGRVVTPDGAPAAGATVSLDWFGDGGARTLSTESGPDGRFALAGVPVEVARRHLGSPGRGLTATPAGWAADRTPGGPAPGLLPLPAPLAGRVCDAGDLPLTPGAVLRGRLLGPDGGPLAGAELEVGASLLVRATTSGPLIAPVAVTTDADGRFATPPLPPGRADVTFAADGFAVLTATQTLDGTLAAVDLRPLRPTPEAPVTLEVTDGSGTPIAGAEVRPFPSYEPTFTGPEGRVPLHRLGPAGAKQTRVNAAGFRSVSLGWEPDDYETLADGTRLYRRALERSRSLRFAATDAATGGPVEVDSVLLCQWEAAPDGTRTVSRCGVVTLDRPAPGVAAVTHFGPHAYHLAISAAGYEPFEAFLDPLAEDADAEVGPFALTPLEPGADAGPAAEPGAGKAGDDAGTQAVTVAGRVLPTGGADPAGALVTLWGSRGPTDDAVNAPLAFGRLTPRPGFCVGLVVADADGRFAVTTPRPGDYVLRADCAPRAAGDGPAAVTPDARPAPAFAPAAVAAGGRADVEFGPEPAGDIAGRLKAISVVRGPAWAVAFDRELLIAAAPVAADGTFRLGPLPPGEYGVKAGRVGDQDRETFNGFLSAWPEAWDTPVDPWRRAVRVTVEPGGTARAEVPLTD